MTYLFLPGVLFYGLDYDGNVCNRQQVSGPSVVRHTVFPSPQPLMEPIPNFSCMHLCKWPLCNPVDAGLTSHR